jgi:hypothetical protein
MKVLKSLITLFVVIAMGVLVYFYVYKTEQTRISRESKERMLVQFDLDAIESFTFIRPDSSIVFERSTGRLWNITAPIEVEAEREELYSLFVELNKSLILYNLGDEIDDMSVYGLENPDYYMCLDYVEGDPDTLFLGNNTPDGSMAYVRFSSNNNVMTVSRDLTERFKWPVNVYRSRTLLNIVKQDITSFEILRNGDESITMVNNGVNWMMRTPWNYPGDAKNMENIAELLSTSIKQTLVEEKTDDMSQYGLDNPRIILTISQRYGVPEKILLIGDELTATGGTHLSYAKQFDKDLIFTMENTFIKNLLNIKVWYINKTPVRVSREAITKIDFEMGDRKIVFSKDYQRNWSVISPIDKNIDREAINHILKITHYILINDVFAYEPTEKDLAEAGFANPKAVITIYQNDTILERVVLGNTVTINEPLTYFTTSKTPFIFGTRESVDAEINILLETVFGN